MKNVTAIIKVSETCNLACEYCYATDRRGLPDKGSFMTLEVLDKVIREIFDFADSGAEFIWHGGEPLLVGLNFYQKVVEIQKKYNSKGLRVINSIQTNGTLMTRRFADFFQKENFRVGISIDGPQFLHDQTRRFSKKTSFTQVTRGLELLKTAGIQPGVLCVVSSKNMKYSKELFEYLVSNPYFTSMDFLPFWEIDPLRDTQELSVSSIDFGYFLIDLFDLWFQYDNPKISIRTFGSVIKGLLGGTPDYCAVDGLCANYLGVDHAGGIYICDWLIGDTNALLGNIAENSLAQITKSTKYRQYARTLLAIPDECRSCGWYKICHNGCKYQKQNNQVYYYCESRKMLYQHIYITLQKTMGRSMPFWSFEPVKLENDSSPVSTF